jgi:hypothetical protein
MARKREFDTSATKRRGHSSYVVHGGPEPRRESLCQERQNPCWHLVVQRLEDMGDLMGWVSFHWVILLFQPGLYGLHPTNCLANAATSHVEA